MLGDGVHAADEIAVVQRTREQVARAAGAVMLTEFLHVKPPILAVVTGTGVPWPFG